MSYVHVLRNTNAQKGNVVLYPCSSYIRDYLSIIKTPDIFSIFGGYALRYVFLSPGNPQSLLLLFCGDGSPSIFLSCSFITNSPIIAGNIITSRHLSLMLKVFYPWNMESLYLKEPMPYYLKIEHITA